MNPMHPIDYNNIMLTQNIQQLTWNQQQFSHYITEIDRLKKENNLLKLEIVKSKLGLDKKIVDDDHKKEQTNKQYNTYIHTFYPITKQSYSKDIINKIISSIHSINDIIKLEPQWEQIRHNKTLQRLYRTIVPLKQLDSMIGLKDVKDEVFKKIIYHTINTYNQSDEYHNTIISGPPGVGKTEFAKIYADIFCKLGVLKTNKFIQAKRDDLIGQYLGETAKKTKELLESAIGGVLFIDEAYSLGHNEKRDSYSKEAIDMICYYLSEKKGQFMLIIAGYEEDMERCFFDFNKGLKRRFHTHFKIDGYSSQEMKDIFIKMLSTKKYNLLDKEKDNITKFFEQNKFENYAGDMERLFNEVKYIQALRVFNDNTNNKIIKLDDIVKSMKIFEKPKEEIPNFYL